jgi:putative SOS response-associated peptidase YedK
LSFNARAEGLSDTASFRNAVRRRRCLVPADAFYEWQRLDAKNKQPYAIALKSGEPYAFAGLWESWKPQDGPPLETFTILTTDPNELTQSLHNRMPVILASKDYDRWLDLSDPGGDLARPPIDLLRPYPADEMQAWPVSQRVGNVRNNDPELLEQAASDRLF